VNKGDKDFIIEDHLMIKKLMENLEKDKDKLWQLVKGKRFSEEEDVIIKFFISSSRLVNARIDLLQEYIAGPLNGELK